MKWEEKRVLMPSKLKRACKEYHLFSLGTDADFEDALRTVKGEGGVFLDTEQIEFLAREILVLTDQMDITLECVMQIVAECCVSLFFAGDEGIEHDKRG